MDVQMTDASIGRSSETIMSDRDLVKTVRSLDQTGPGANGENIDRVWKQLTSANQSPFSAAEESVLRWLLKVMKTNNDEAETIRRFPLTWRILGCAFQRIPLFSLAKSLADRKFMAVLQQTLKGVAKPSTGSEKTSDSKSKKRKRTSTATFQLHSLKSFEGCLGTGEAIFCALKTLLARLDPAAQWSAHDRMGAEHIKALFAQPATDVVEYLGPLLSICDSSLAVSDPEPFEAQESWVRVFSSTWELHLQGSADALEVATHFSRTSFSILGKIKQRQDVEDSVARLWARDLDRFLQRNLVLPARSAYLNRSDLEVVIRAFEMVKSNASASVPILYSMVSAAPRVVGGLTTAKAEDAWMQEVFKMSERMIKQLSSDRKSQAMSAVLEEAITNKSRIALDDLRMVCNNYAIAGSPSETDWRLLSLVAKCDADVFLQSEEGLQLFDQLCDRITAAGAEADEATMRDLIESLITGFESARDLSTFLQKWFAQLSKFEDKALRFGDRPVWFTRVHRNSTLIDGIEKSLTTKQIVSLLQWVESHENLRPAAVLTFLNTIASAITKDDFADAVGTQLSDLALKVWSSSKTPSDIRSLRWRIVSKTVSWLDYERATALWDKVQADLTKALQKAKFDDEDTCEALECAYYFWLAMYPDGRDQTDLASLLSSFIERLLKKVKFEDLQGLFGAPGLSSIDTSDVPRFCSEFPLAASRLVALLAKSSGTLPDYLQRMLSEKVSQNSKTQLANVFHAVVSNENNFCNRKLAGGVVDYAIEILMNISGKSSPWAEERSRVIMVELSRMPDESITRQQRERLMGILVPKVQAAEKIELANWHLVLGLFVKIMRRPTFYPNMSFSDLQDIANSLAPLCDGSDSTTALGLSQLLYQLVTATARQMNDHQEWRTQYFGKVSTLLKDLAGDGSCVQMTLLKALLVVVLPEAGSKEKVAVFDIDETASALGSLIQDTLSGFAKAWRKQKVEKTLVNRVLIALDAAEALPEAVVKQMKVKVSQLEESSQQAISSGYFSGWKLQSFLIKRFPSKVANPQPTSFGQLFSSASSAPLPSGPAPDPLADFNRQTVLEDTVDAAMAGLDYNGKVQYVQNLLAGVQTDAASQAGPSSEGQLLAIHRVVSQMTEAPAGLEKCKTFDLATAHGTLIRYLAQTKTVREFVRTAEVLQQLLDVKSNAMTQWNIEATLSTVAVIVADDPGHLLVASSSVYQWLCKLMEVIIKKHRLRLEGHYHILVTTLEALLGALTPHPSSSAQHKASASLSAKHAAQFTRLVTLICEPAAAAVSRVQHLSALDSATDAAKRSAGRHMYLVLMAYVKMQLDVDVPRDVREALEPGMNSIFNITPLEVRKILNDSMDTSGRAILREMYKRYTKFGKWSGV
ncbi:Urb2/Npa2 family protein [Colletotrichum higginsianum IMI 349063]|uniref:Urb2/Npa2 family protein n=3 Tax=Colletotrichum higginsianum TaxID=80884 RepID=A0A1B7YNK1_COLHI|nr:Urb2/Npa2 family protein [Colletotrichum higginsianum IMI 349063]OBR13512.1 Urb2/Npa2 family protein [Colletotrichum higginsianum IMI 349063]TID02773.1 Nucleolar pre-ribosomal-associated protein 2 [Colletotrichum higginsianum]